MINLINLKCSDADINENNLDDILQKSYFIKIDDFSPVDEITTNLEFESLEGKTKLDTIMDILEHFLSSLL